MPPQIKKQGSIIILSTLLTSLLTAVILWAAATFFNMYAQSIELPFIKTELSKLSISITDMDNTNKMVLGFIHDGQLERQKIMFDLQACKSHVEKCPLPSMILNKK